MKRVLILSIVCLAACVLTATTPALGDENADALAACQQEVLLHLKAPATAKFDNISIMPGRPPNIAVTFSVDAENSFGALIRTWGACPYDPTAKKAKVIIDTEWQSLLREMALEAAKD